MEIQLWREILSPYQLAVNELVVKFNHIIEEYRSKGQYSPIEQVVGRVKKISSILDKMNRSIWQLKRLRMRLMILRESVLCVSL